MTEFSLDGIIQQLAGLNANSQQRAGQLTGAYGAAEGEMQQQASHLQRIGQLTSDAERSRLQMQLETENARIDAANAAGMNVNDVGNIILGLHQQMKQAGTEMIRTQQDLAKLNAESDLIGNPMGWVRGLLYRSEIEGAANQASSNFDTVKKVISDSNAAVQSTALTQNAIQRTLNAQTIDQLAEAKKLQSEVAASQARVEAQKFSIGALEMLQSMEANQFNRNMQMTNAMIDDQRWREGFELRKAQFEEAQASRKARQQDEEFYAEQTAWGNAAAERLGLRPRSVAEYKRFLGTNSPEGQRLQMLVEQGYNLETNGSLAPLGATPAEAFINVQAVGIDPPPAHRPVRNLVEAAKQTTAFAEATNNPRATPESVTHVFNEEIQKAATAQSKNVTQAGNNANAVPEIATILAAGTPGAQRLAQSKFGTEVLAAMVSTDNGNPEAEVLMATGLAAVNEGKITFQELQQGVAAFYQEGVNLTAATGGFQLYSIKAPTTYEISIDRIRPDNKWYQFGGQGVGATNQALLNIAARATGLPADSVQLPTRLDMTKPEAVAKALTLMQAGNIAAKIQEQSKSGQQQ
tara:strand:+ start:29613 stop:31349 length:1737 start_codon:yes stop_codon:yes gene_type:complete